MQCFFFVCLFLFPPLTKPFFSKFENFENILFSFLNTGEKRD